MKTTLGDIASDISAGHPQACALYRIQIFLLSTLFRGYAVEGASYNGLDDPFLGSLLSLLFLSLSPVLSSLSSVLSLAGRTPPSPYL
jgi:hypothetical protein